MATKRVRKPPLPRVSKSVSDRDFIESDEGLTYLELCLVKFILLEVDEAFDKAKHSMVVSTKIELTIPDQLRLKEVSRKLGVLILKC